jgi:acyl-CoA synthetase (AMP-forming)/AMP-acid ligase II
MIDQLRKLAQAHPSAPFVFFEDQTVDFGATADLAARGAAWLARLGVQPGDHVLLAVSNRPLFLFYWFALAARGAVAVTISHDTFGDSLRYMARQSDSRMALTEGAEAVRLRAELDGIGIPVVSHETEADFASAMQGFEPAAVQPMPPHAPMAILYTSGTTGQPKGVVIPQASYRAAGEKVVDAIGITRDDRILTFLPLHHANPQMYAVMSALTVGCSLVLVPRFSASRFLDQVRRHRATGFTYVGTVLSILAKEIPEAAATTLRWCTGGGAPRAVWQELAPRLGVEVHELYGMTETGGLVTINSRAHGRFGSVGRSRDDFDIALVDDDDALLHEGVGEIVVRPRKPYVMTSGYYRKPEETAAATSNLWFHTGDLGRFDGDGYLFFEGRKKELIRRAGEMISPVTIELSALRHPAIADCAAVGVPDPILEEEIKLVVVQRSEVRPAEIVAFLADVLPRHMLPRYVEFVSEIPKTPTQKVQRFKLTGITQAVHDLKHPAAASS